MNRPKKARFDSVGKAKDVENLGERFKILLGENDKAARLIQALTYQGFQYASHIIPEVADSPLPLDDATRWGFGHDVGPFEIWDMLGVKQTVKAMTVSGFHSSRNGSIRCSQPDLRPFTNTTRQGPRLPFTV